MQLKQFFSVIDTQNFSKDKNLDYTGIYPVDMLPLIYNKEENHVAIMG
ncbi:MAG TPA: hypothetical protein VKP78_03495 [bacterium]|nr:hypothetical protein [bacterium]